MEMNLVQAIMYNVPDEICIKEFWIKEKNYYLIKNAIDEIENSKICIWRKDAKLRDIEKPQIVKFWYKDIVVPKQS